MSQQTAARTDVREQTGLGGPHAALELGDPAGLVAYAPVEAGGQVRATWIRVRHLPTLLLVCDALACVMALAAARLLVGLDASDALVVTAAALGGAAAAGRGSRDRVLLSVTTLEEIPGLLPVASTATLAVIAAVEVLAGTPLTAGGLAAFWVLVFGSMVLLRLGTRRIAVRAGTPDRAVLVGAAPERSRFRRHLGTAALPLVRLVGQADFDELGRGDDDRPTVERLVAEHRADRLVVLPGADVARSAQLVRRARNAGITVTVASQLVESLGPDTHVEPLGGSVVLTARPAGPGPTGAGFKRLIDLTGALVGLVFLAPVLALLALAVKLDSPGPVLFRQRRVGRGGIVFHICKFRTMDADAEARRAALLQRNETAGLFKLTEDPRITRSGRLLRRTSLDELPQLLNVLWGHMSLVGPRPLICEEDALIEGWHRDRLRVKPGMTGPWQVLGSARIPLHDMVLLDQQYVANWSLWLDLRILLRTVAFVFARRGL